MYNIKASKSVPGMFEAEASDGSIFNHKGKTAYKSERGLKIALSRMGQVYAEAEKPLALVSVGPKSFETSQAHKLGFSKETCAKIYSWVVEQRKGGFVGNFGQMAEKLSKGIGQTITNEQMYAAFRSGQAMHLEATKEERAEKAATRAAEKAAKVEAPKVETGWNAEAANAVAKLHGFTNGYRGVRRAAENADSPRHSEAVALRPLCIAAGQGKTLVATVAKAQPAPARNEAELFAALESFKVA